MQALFTPQAMTRQAGVVENICIQRVFAWESFFFIPSNVNWWEKINFPQPNEKREMERFLCTMWKSSEWFFPPADDAALMIFLWTYIGGSEKYYSIFLSAPYLYECLCFHNNNIFHASQHFFLWRRIFHAQYSIPSSLNSDTHMERKRIKINKSTCCMLEGTERLYRWYNES